MAAAHASDDVERMPQDKGAAVLRAALVTVLVAAGLAGGGEDRNPLLEHRLTTVAVLLEAKGRMGGVHRLARVFDGPRGDGRAGARGVVVRGGRGWSELGTRWRFRWLRSGSAWGVQIIHPLREGQVMIHVKKKGLGVSTPRAWREVGYGGGDAKPLTRTDAFEEVFPLEAGRLYQLDSVLRPDGAYQLSIDDEAVATATFRVAHPLSFAIGPGQRFPLASGWGELTFAGKGFPERWEAGYGGVLLEPLDSGRNQAVGVTFAPALARLKTDRGSDF